MATMTLLESYWTSLQETLENREAFLYPEDVWIIDDNAKSHEASRLNLDRKHSACSSLGLRDSIFSLVSTSGCTQVVSPTPDSPPRWDKVTDSVVGFANAQKDRWGTKKAPNSGSPSSGANAPNDTSPEYCRKESRRIPTSLKVLPFQEEYKRDVQADSESMLHKPCRRQSLDLEFMPSDKLIMPQRRDSDLSSTNTSNASSSEEIERLSSTDTSEESAPKPSVDVGLVVPPRRSSVSFSAGGRRSSMDSLESIPEELRLQLEWTMGEGKRLSHTDSVQLAMTTMRRAIQRRGSAGSEEDSLNSSMGTIQSELSLQQPVRRDSVLGDSFSSILTIPPNTLDEDDEASCASWLNETQDDKTNDRRSWCSSSSDPCISFGASENNRDAVMSMPTRRSSIGNVLVRTKPSDDSELEELDHNSDDEIARNPLTRTDSRDLALHRRYQRRHALMAQAEQPVNAESLPPLVDATPHCSASTVVAPSESLQALQTVQSTTSTVNPLPPLEAVEEQTYVTRSSVEIVSEDSKSPFELQDDSPATVRVFLTNDRFRAMEDV